MVAVYYYYLLPFVFPAILSSVLGLSSQDHQSQLYQAKLRITQSESRLEEITQNINDRDLYLEKSEILIGELDHKLNHLQSVLSLLKAADDKIKGLEEEVRVLWATLRKNNFDIHVLESKAREAEDRLEMITSQAEKFIVIHGEDCVVGNLMETIFHGSEKRYQGTDVVCRVSLQKHKCRIWLCSPVICSFFSCLSGEHLPNAQGLFTSHFSEESALRAYVSQTFSWLKRFYSTVKESHHELQVFIKQEMERHEFTACLANKEIVFFVASALIIFPVLSAWILLSSQLC
ncbi:hypothetical protein SADUNF_Sadunf04G0031200 [Salix dunnii]|uniref:Uncharacterized protein n=1 Tax=Salix dunnii TaxID=1413687 RepID=A0A835K6N1_9ROSI|nr:hypothetical protein SADUNF_Sadunf04G0031200 [Salix dunnii]